MVKMMKGSFQDLFAWGVPGNTFTVVIFFFRSLHKFQPHLDPPLIWGRGLLIQTSDEI